MLKKLIKGAVIVLLVIVGLSAGLGYGYLQVQDERKSCQGKINELNKKMSLLQKKGSEERELRVSAEGRARSLQAELEKFRKDNAALIGHTKGLEEVIQACEVRVRQAAEQSARIEAARNETIAGLAQAHQAIKELDSQLKLLATGKVTLEMSLKKVNLDLDQCRSHNAKLCTVSDDLLKEFSKGTSILHKEPVLQIKKVELEKLAQDYRERIAQDKLKQ